MIKVLVVDDSALVRKLFGAALSGEADMALQFARNGLEALAMLETFQPDVVTLDIHMPGMNGLECLDRIMMLRPSPVLMVSSLTAEGADETLQALRLGAVDFVAKPGGAVSMRMAQFAPTLIEKIRVAATVRLRTSRRLVERVKLRSAGARATTARAARRPAPNPADIEAGPSAGRLSKSLAAPSSSPSLSPSSIPSSIPLAIPSSSPQSGERLVVVGVSTGGPPALEALLTGLPANFPWPIVIAQHMPASFTGPLAARLNGITGLRVVEVAGPLALEPGCAYIGRGDGDVVIARRPAGLVATPVPAQADYPWHPSADRLVRSAMALMAPAQIIGILMTGMGNDGAIAMAQLHAQGGLTIAEAQDTAVIWGMPGALVNAGGATFVESLPAIADRLQEMVTTHAADS